jgi:hypothetical protein
MPTHGYVLFEGHTVVGVYPTTEAACSDLEPLDVVSAQYRLLGQHGELHALHASPLPKRSSGFLSRLGIVWSDQRESRVVAAPVVEPTNTATMALFARGLREYLAAVGSPSESNDLDILLREVGCAWKRVESR